jgi:enoyl-[acyl-carrier protein] reductase III
MSATRDDAAGPRRVALITGGSRGIGRAVAGALARRGVDVAGNYQNDHESAAAVAAEAEKHGARAVPIQAHIGDVQSRAELWEKFDAAFPRLDFLVANAATGVHRPALELTPNSLRKVFAVNVDAFLALAGEAVRRMPEPATPAPGARGRIVALSSIGAERVLRDYGSVGASKAALEAFVRQLAVELGPRGISVNTVRCGLCDTGVLAYVKERTQIIAETVARTPAGRLVTPDEVAALVCFALGPEAGMLTGQVLNIDGGYSATCS